MYLTNILADSHRLWQPGDEVYISAPTGIGKSTYIIQQLLPSAINDNLEILYLTNRQLLNNEIIHKLCDYFYIPYDVMANQKIAEFNGITVMTYQTFQEIYQEGNRLYFHYVVADEIHYVYSDASFNPNTAFFLKWLKHKTCDIFIALSATIEEALPVLGFYNDWNFIAEKENMEVYTRKPQNILNGLRGKMEFLYFYKIPRAPVDYEIFCYKNSDELITAIHNSPSQDKWLIFQSNKHKAQHELKAKIQCDCVFLNADTKDNSEMQSIVTRNKFESKVLITTKVLDNGVNLCDTNIRHIVLDTIDKTDFLQMLGRRRILSGESQKLKLYLPLLSDKYFSSLLYGKILPILNFMQTDSNSLLEKIIYDQEAYRFSRQLCYCKNNQLFFNPIAKNFYEEKKSFCEKMVTNLRNDELAFLKLQLHWLGLEENFSNIINLSKLCERSILQDLESIIQQNLSVVLEKSCRYEFREQIDVFLRTLLPHKFPHKGEPAGHKKINDCLAELNLNYKISAIYGKKKGETVKWIVTKKIQ